MAERFRLSNETEELIGDAIYKPLPKETDHFCPRAVCGNRLFDMCTGLAYLRCFSCGAKVYFDGTWSQ